MPKATRPVRLLSLLVPAFPVINPNLDVLRPALLRAGVQFEERAFDHVRLRGCDVEAPDVNGDYAPLRDAALLWPLGFGTRTNFLDKLQLLELACRDTRSVTAPDALVLAHAKYDLVRTTPPLRHPETYASHDARWLWGIVQSGGEWIAKPPAASFGRGVFRLDARDRNGLAVLEQLTEHGRGTLALLQRYVPEIAQGEKRVLLAFGTVIGAYARLPNAAGITNLAAGAHAVATSLDAEETAACTALAQQLQSRGIGFAGIDLVYPWLIEVNIANPGGLATLVELGDVGAPDRLAAAVAGALNAR